MAKKLLVFFKNKLNKINVTALHGSILYETIVPRNSLTRALLQERMRWPYLRLSLSQKIRK